MSSDNRPWSVFVDVDEIPETGAHYELSADAATRDSVARTAGLRDLPKFEATFDVARHGPGVAVKGEVRGEVGQTCVVTLEPIENEVREIVDLVFAPSSEVVAEGKQSSNPPEPLENGLIDLGAVATEFLMLGLDPYPRKPGAEFGPTPAEPKAESPFAALAGLKKRT